jgi:outer membrane protein OmpA-like peptidoglycan-associated protein
MAIKKRLLATAAIPFLAIAGAGLPASAAVIRPAVAIEAQSPVIAVQSEEELLPKRQRKRDAQEAQDPAATDSGNDAAAEEPVRRKRKDRQQAEEQQMQESMPADNADAVEDPAPRKRKKQQQAEEQQQIEPERSDNAEAIEEPAPKKRRKQQQAEEQRIDDGQPSDNAEAVEEPIRKKRKNQQQAEDQPQDAQPTDQVSDEDIINQSKKRKKRQQAEDQQQMDEPQPSDNAEATEEPVRKKRNKDQQQAEEQQQTDEVRPSDNAEATEEPVRKKRNKDQQQAEEQQTSDPAEVSDEDIVNQSRKKKKRDQAEAETPEAIEKREEIAKDPSKTADTVVLPVENGAAVLDSDKDADNGGANRERRKRQREKVEEVRVPESDKDAQKIDVDIKIKPVVELKGERVDDFKGYRRPEGKNVGKGDDVRVVFDLDGKIVIRSDDHDRIGRNEQFRYERLRDDRIKEIVVRPNGDRVVTIRNRWGEIIRRSRIDNRDVEIVIFYSPALDRGRDRLYLRDPGDELPPMRLRVPIDDYIIDVSSNRGREYDYEEFLAKPPVEQVERVYSVEEVKYSARIRDKVRRIDLDTITFETGSAEIDRDQASTLREVAQAIGDILQRDPGETFLIEGHTDAVGSDESNLVLSDERAESIANVLTELFDIPAENLVTQGYGERYLKIDTEGDERENRRVTIRRITPLVRPAEVSEN